LAQEKRAQVVLVAAIVIAVIIVAVVAYYFLNKHTPDPPNPATQIMNSGQQFEGTQYVYKITAKVTNNGGDGNIKVFAEKKQYDEVKILDHSVYLKNNESTVLEFIFGLDPYVKELPSTPTPTPTPDPNAPQPTMPPISCRVWAEPD
jgi:uncharacterized protein YxeA